ncbi:MAG TPA: AraC family transcriptional regulator [Spongiibacteraceae bacterium]|nr:AraC family transcriptional regulator [Spongiibacteraceae bacterium]HCS26364.1 AraC family transcriptional regulator [Spongiibacteraceae bacterium]
MSREAFVSSAYVGLLYEFLQARGEDPVSLLGQPWPDHRRDPLGRFPMDLWADLLQRAEQKLGTPAMGIEIGRLITPAHIGILGYALLACANLAEALVRFERYVRLVYDHGPMGTHFDGKSIELEWGDDCLHPGQLADEVALTALVQFARNVTNQRLHPDYVCFLNPAPDDVAPYEAYFGCPVEFEQASTIVRFPIEQLDLPLRQPDPVLLSILEAQADKLLAELPVGDGFEQDVRRAISRRCRTGEPALGAVAGDLNLSGRSLQRRLQSRGFSFQGLLDETRLMLAKDYLRDGHLQLTEVAQMLGYSEQSAFNHAFRRWTGQSPRKYRQRTMLTDRQLVRP